MIRLIHGDCLEKFAKIKSGSIDLVLCDPPYGITACKWDSVIPLDPMWKELKRVIKTNVAIVIFGVEPFSTILRVSNLKFYKYDWTWDKITAKGHLVAKYRPMQQTENISVFAYHRHNYYPIMIDRPLCKIQYTRETKRTELMGGISNMSKNKKYDKWYPKTILSFKTERGLHPTQKPVALMEYLIRTYTNEGDRVLDFAMGSGTTGVACKRLGRSFIGIELDREYFRIAKERISGA